MRFSTPLVQGTLIKRYKRFLADVDLDGETVTAHCANPGSMLGLAQPGARIWLSKSDNPSRKLQYSWELVEVDLGAGPALVGINTAHPNGLVAEAIKDNTIKELCDYPSMRREVKYGANSRIDILLQNGEAERCYVEIKNVHLMRERGIAEFPDSVTARGAKHLEELAKVARDGHRAVMVYLVQRNDASELALARDIDPAYGAAFDAARAAGVDAFVFVGTCSVYGRTEAAITEEFDCDPESPYGESKLAAEEAMLDRHDGGLALSVLRLGTVYGWTTGMRFDTVVDKFALLAATNQPLTVYRGAEDQRRPYLHVQDAVRAMLFAADRLGDGEPYNVVGQNGRLQDVVDAIERHFPGVEIGYTEAQELNQLSYIVSDEKIRRAGFETGFTIDQGVAELADRFRGLRRQRSRSEPGARPEVASLRELDP
jgi:sugar fermentation stimulation protein